MKKVIFRGEECIVDMSRCYRGSEVKAIQLYDGQGFPMCTASVNVPDEHLAADETAIKDYDENTGVLKALVDGGIVTPTGKYAFAGFEMAPICKIVGADDE